MFFFRFSFYLVLSEVFNVLQSFIRNFQHCADFFRYFSKQFKGFSEKYFRRGIALATQLNAPYKKMSDKVESRESFDKWRDLEEIISSSYIYRKSLRMCLIIHTCLYCKYASEVLNIQLILQNVLL